MSYLLAYVEHLFSPVFSKENMKIVEKEVKELISDLRNKGRSKEADQVEATARERKKTIQMRLDLLKSSDQM